MINKQNPRQFGEDFVNSLGQLTRAVPLLFARDIIMNREAFLHRI
jgi:hypothetical protein